MFSVAPLNRSIMHSFIPHLHTYYASSQKKFYLVTSWPHLMQPLKANSHWKMKVMRVALKLLTYPLLSDVLPEYTMFPAMTTSPLTLPPQVAQVPASHATNLYNASYPSAPLMMNTLHQLTFHLLTALYYHKTPRVFPSATFQMQPYHMWWPRGW